jgi:hypothetical protein
MPTLILLDNFRVAVSHMGLTKFGTSEFSENNAIIAHLLVERSNNE